MSQKSEWLGFNELFELSEGGVISLLIKELHFLGVLELARDTIACGHEKNLIQQAKDDFKRLIKDLTSKENNFPLSEKECEKLMEKIYLTVKNIVEFTEYEFLN